MRSMINFHVVPQKPFLATVEWRKLQWFGRVTREDSLSKTIVQGTWRVGVAVVGRRNAGWTTKNGHPCPCQNCSQGPPDPSRSPEPIHANMLHLNLWERGEKACQNRKVLSWALNSHRVGRLCRLEGSELPTGGGMKLRDRSSRDFRVRLGIFQKLLAIRTRCLTAASFLRWCSVISLWDTIHPMPPLTIMLAMESDWMSVSSRQQTATTSLHSSSSLLSNTEG